MSTWHRFLATSDDDLECVNLDCGVVVDEAALRLLTVGCPAPACGEDANAGGCVFVPTERGPACAYCDAAGGTKGATGPEDDDDLDQLLAGLDVGVEDVGDADFFA